MVNSSNSLNNLISLNSLTSLNSLDSLNRKNKSQRNLDLSDNTVSPRKPMVYHQLPHCLIAIFVQVPFSNTPPNLQMDHHFWWLKLQVSK